VAPYTLEFDRDDKASRRREAPKKFSGRWRRRLYQNQHATTAVARGAGEGSVTAAREGRAPAAQRNAPRPASLPRRHGRPREARQRNSHTTIFLLLAATAGQERRHLCITESTVMTTAY
jgi:hypothetical protein